ASSNGTESPNATDNGTHDAQADGDDVTTALVVDDNAEVRSYVKQHLVPRYRVLEAVNGEQGLDMARRLLPDLVLADVMMPVIEAKLGDDGFTVERLASEVAQSRGNLHRKLRELLGESPSDRILSMRLERAAELLEARAGSVGEVAYAVGFKSVAHFSNAFN